MKRKSVTLGEAEIRSALRTRLLAQNADDADTVLIEELGVSRGQVRIDVALVNGRFHGYETKSDLDSLRRLDRQVYIYSSVLDRATLVAGDRHIADAVEFLPDWWGVLRASPGTKGVRFTNLRRGRQNPRRNPRVLVELLWLDDAVALLERRDAARGIRGKPRRVVWDRVCDHFSTEEIAAVVRLKLKERVAPPDLP
jgi:hypothetical protein